MKEIKVYVEGIKVILESCYDVKNDNGKYMNIKHTND